jgi:phage shock protein PspC (stress-responsive transcriptional regulator)
MKKTLTISISGLVFHIEEDAYDKLHRYLETIKSHFKGFEGKDEVISDIEARIAEILQKKITGNKEVVTLEDIEEVISIMGQPSDYAMDGDATGSGSDSTYSSLPKRLYRDPERKTIGGVCSGLGAYFNLDPVWVRIIFLVSIFISGFGLLVYLILWLVVPEARTAAEKLEMRGEPVTVSNIEKSVSDEMHDLKDKLNDFASKAKTTYHKQKSEFKTQHKDRLSSGLGDMARIFLRIFLVFAGIIILFIGIALTVVYLSILLRFPVIAVMDQAGLQAFPLYSIIEKIFANDAGLRAFVTGMMILIGIPLIMMIWGGIRMVFNLPRVRLIAGLAGIIWLCALIITLVFGFKVANSFSRTGEFARQVPLDIRGTDTLYVTTDGRLPLDENWERSGIFYFPDERIAVMNDSEVLYGIPLLKFKLSDDSTGHINVATLARGTTTMEAMETAERVDYKWNQNGDTLVLSDNFTLPANEKWRMQETRVELFLPEGTTVNFNENVYPIMGYHKNISRHERIGTMYIMSNEGLVKSEK